MLKHNSSDYLANAFDEVISSTSFQKIFKKPQEPKIKIASIEKSAVEVIFDNLVQASAELDDMGFEDSSAMVLEAAQSFIYKKTAAEKVDDLLADFDTNEVIDKPSEDDKKEGDPEKC